MHPMLNTAIRAARAAGTVILRHMERARDLPVESKGRNDFVTEVDHLAESAIIQHLHKAYPHHAILAEESGEHGKNQDFLWIIDPLDGTTNYLHGFPQFAVSIALQYRGKLDQAVIYDPLKNELFTASRGSGAQLDNRRIHVSKQTRLEGALLGTGFPFKELDHLDEYLETFRALITRTAGIRRAGAAALDLAYVACGRLDGFWEYGLKPWDMAAGVLLIEEAGGLVSGIPATEDYMQSGNIT
ncbi:MAG: inositol monophosphatase family protein [Gammaproteobacteria bacterium]|nr:inositol monophosphatase family protein [Gammaproteobacteria bacterium]